MPRMPLLALLLFLSTTAHANPVTLDLVTGGSDGSFGFSYLHEATGSPTLDVATDNGNVDFYKGGTGYLLTELEAATANIVGTQITFLSGLYQVGDGSMADLMITGGTIDFTTTGPDEFGSNAIETNYGSFAPLDRQWVGNAITYPPNTFSPTEGFLSVWANNWNSPNGPVVPVLLDDVLGQSVDYAPGWGLDFVVTFVPAPEPGTAMLLGTGLLVLGARGRRPGC